MTKQRTFSNWVWEEFQGLYGTFYTPLIYFNNPVIYFNIHQHLIWSENDVCSGTLYTPVIYFNNPWFAAKMMVPADQYTPVLYTSTTACFFAKMIVLSLTEHYTPM